MRLTITLLLSCLLLACANQNPGSSSNPQACLDLADSVWDMSIGFARDIAKTGVDTDEALMAASEQLLANKELCFAASRAGPTYLSEAMVLIADQGKMIAQGILIGLEAGVDPESEKALGESNRRA